jgi:3-phosphoshikimate 1-carboxyvinyltransferase
VRLVVDKSEIGGSVAMPGSKSHTIRAVTIATLAEGTSRIERPLDSLDTQAAVTAARALGAGIEVAEDEWVVSGTGGELQTPEDVVCVGNSGTTLYFCLGMAALGDGWTILTGDAQTRSRPAGPLLAALRSLGAEAFSTRGTGCAPIAVRGRLRGGSAEIECPTSQYLSSLLLSCPLADGDTELAVPLLNERPYVEMTLAWLKRRGVEYEHDDGMEHLRIPGGQRYAAFREAIAADFSSATFFLCAAAVTGAELTLQGLDMEDTQGDKAVVGMLERMGCKVATGPDWVRIRGGDLRAAELDLNATPDALPALAATACFARGETRLVNVPQARLKETDRIAVMREALSAMGGDVEELPNGLIVRQSRLRGAAVSGHGDHRVVMALAVAGLAAEGRTEIDTAESVQVTFPSFVELMESVGARVSQPEA